MLYAALADYDFGGPTPIDGRPHIEAAAAMGATAILTATGTPIPDSLHARSDIAFISYDQADLVFAHIAANFYAAQPRCMAAVTGTNGKTSTAHFTRQLWALAGHKAGSLGTLGLLAPHINEYDGATTPNCAALHRKLAMLAENGINHCVMEASSHGLQQHRMHAVKLRVAGVTNLTRDHLNYHKTVEAYHAAKLRLFTEVLPYDGIAVLNADDGNFAEWRAEIAKTTTTIMTYGRAGNDITLLNVAPHSTGQILQLRAGGSEYTVDLPMVGTFAIENALCAALMVVASGEPMAITIENLAHLQPVPGRMEMVGKTAHGAQVFVDYAHSPDALEGVLRTLRPYTKRRLQVLFGVGGSSGPAPEKCAQMGHIAAAYADTVYITDDNPWHEDPAAIRARIKAGAPNGIEIPDRAIAIQTAINTLQPGDVLVLAGKGHEQTQIIGDTVLPFDDAEMARFALRATNVGAA